MLQPWCVSRSESLALGSMLHVLPVLNHMLPCMHARRWFYSPLRHTFCVCPPACSYMTAAFSAMHHMARDRGLSLRTAAYMVALQRLARAATNLGHG